MVFLMAKKMKNQLWIKSGLFYFGGDDMKRKRSTGLGECFAALLLCLNQGCCLEPEKNPQNQRSSDQMFFINNMIYDICTIMYIFFYIHGLHGIQNVYQDTVIFDNLIIMMWYSHSFYGIKRSPKQLRFIRPFIPQRALTFFPYINLVWYVLVILGESTLRQFPLNRHSLSRWIPAQERAPVWCTDYNMQWRYIFIWNKQHIYKLES